MKLQWTGGNRIELLENGEEYYPAVFSAIDGARREVQIETFILFEDPVGERLRSTLIAAARRGVRVDLLIDGWGSPDLSEGFFDGLRRAGVRVHVFEPVARWSRRLGMFRRMHRKLVVIDGSVAFVGGINFSIDHLREYGPLAKQDYAVRIEGPLAERIHRFCLANVGGPAGGDSPRRGIRRPRRARADAADAAGAVAGADAGGAVAAFVVRDNQRHRDDIERQYRMALRLARRRAIVANAYFFPGLRLLRELRRAARRGVEVHLVLQGMPDMPMVRTVASLLYPPLLRAGVRIHEYCERPLHGKVAVVDDVWATVGSSNLDPTSLALNLEANVVIRDPAFAGDLAARLMRLVREQCREVRPEPSSPLGDRWARVRGFLVFHAVRYFPRLAAALPEQRPRIAVLGTDTAHSRAAPLVVQGPAAPASIAGTARAPE